LDVGAKVDVGAADVVGCIEVTVGDTDRVGRALNDGAGDGA
jgi:hypothetical protein